MFWKYIKPFANTCSWKLLQWFKHGTETCKFSLCFQVLTVEELERASRCTDTTCTEKACEKVSLACSEGYKYSPPPPPHTHTHSHKQHMHFCIKFVPPHDKTNKMTCAPSEDSDQPWHPPSLIQSLSLCAQWEAKDPRFLHADSGQQRL